MALPDPELIDLLHAALASPVGIAVDTSDPILLRQRLYIARQGDPAFAALSFHIGPTNPSELWITKNANATPSQPSLPGLDM